MKREELKALGLPDDQIDKVMALHGQTMNETKALLDAANTKATNLETQVSTLTTNLTNAQQSGADTAQLKKDLAAAKANLESIQKTQKITAAMAEYKPQNVSTLMKLIDLDKVTFTDAGVVGLKEQMEALKTEQPFLFTNAVPPKGGGDPNPNPQTATDYAPRIKAAQEAGDMRLLASLYTQQAVEQNKPKE